MATDQSANLLASLALFADLDTPQLEAIDHTFEEVAFAPSERILRQGISGSNFYVILDGEAAVRIDGSEVATLARGDFFGEMSLLLGEAPTADIVARTALRCLMLAGPDMRQFLLRYPPVMYRMLGTMALRLRAANRRSDAG
jgi:CRP-like cAMP-binding protein